MKLVLWVLCVLIVGLLLEIIWINHSFSKMFVKGIVHENNKENVSDIIDYEVNVKYSHIKIYNLFSLSFGYLTAIIGMDIVYNLMGINNFFYLRVLAGVMILVISLGIISIFFQNYWFRKIIYRLLTAARSDEKYIEDVIKYRRDVYLGITAQTLISMLLISWFLLELACPDAVLLYPFPKLSIVVVFGYILQYFIVDSRLDAIYWKYYSIDFRKFINKVFKK